MREVVQRAGISQWLQETRTGLCIATKELAVKLLLTQGQIHRRHDVGLLSSKNTLVTRRGRGKRCSYEWKGNGIDDGRYPWDYVETSVTRRQQTLEFQQALAGYLFYDDGQRWPVVCPARIDYRDSRLMMRVYPLGRPGQGRCRFSRLNTCVCVRIVPHPCSARIKRRRRCHPGVLASAGQCLPRMTRQRRPRELQSATPVARGGENIGAAEGESDRAIWLRGE